jgi:arsenate reductase
MIGPSLGGRLGDPPLPRVTHPHGGQFFGHSCALVRRISPETDQIVATGRVRFATVTGNISTTSMQTPAQKFRILFLCTWNASRSIFAEFFMKELGSDRFEAFSAGVTPKGQVSPITLRVLHDKFGIDASGARSKSWEEFKNEHLEFVVSVSELAEQTSHAFPGRPILAHWPYDDPAQVHGTPEQIEAAYFRVASRIRYRLQLFNNLSFDQLDRLRIEVQMKQLTESVPPH